MNSTQIILASQSPRRNQLLNQIGITPFCFPVDIDEKPHHNEIPLAYCLRLASEKAQAGWSQVKQRNSYLAALGSDTVVVLGNEIFGKPINKKHAFEMIMKLSDQKHLVITAVAMVNETSHVIRHSISQVEFCKIPVSDIENYVNSLEPMDKAGSYGIQGIAAQWIKNISGSYSGIMGLPLYETAQMIKGLKHEK